MTVRWSELEEPWRLAFQQAVFAYLERDSVPIGAVVVNGAGRVIAQGANTFSAGRLAHAELNALVGLPADAERGTCEIYSTLEPCPMCTGAIRMSQLRAVHFAAGDPSAGSTRLLDANEFMREFPCVVHTPAHDELEAVVVSLIVEYRNRTGHMRWLEHWRTYHPHGVAQGLKLFESAAHASWVARSVSAQFIYEHVVSMLL